MSSTLLLKQTSKKSHMKSSIYEVFMKHGPKGPILNLILKIGGYI